MIHAYLIGGPSDLTKVALQDDSAPGYYYVAEASPVRPCRGHAPRAELGVYTHDYRLAYVTNQGRETLEVAVYLYEGAHRHA